VWPESNERDLNLEAALVRIRKFRANYRVYVDLNARANAALSAKMDAIYRDCQHFAIIRLKDAVEDALRELMPGKSLII
jgi:hypothetical protein